MVGDIVGTTLGKSEGTKLGEDVGLVGPNVGETEGTQHSSWRGNDWVRVDGDVVGTIDGNVDGETVGVTQHMTFYSAYLGEMMLRFLCAETCFPRIKA